MLTSNSEICLLFSDELASEALYSSWKPFMDGNDNNKGQNSFHVAVLL